MTVAAPIVELDDSAHQPPPMTFTEAARALRLSRARLAERILNQELTLVAPGLVDRDEVESMVERFSATRPERRGRRAANRLARVPEMALWLLHDWGGAARVSELAATLETSLASTQIHLNALREQGFLGGGGNNQDWTLTPTGWGYVKQHSRPIV